MYQNRGGSRERRKSVSQSAKKGERGEGGATTTTEKGREGEEKKN